MESIRVFFKVSLFMVKPQVTISRKGCTEVLTDWGSWGSSTLPQSPVFGYQTETFSTPTQDQTSSCRKSPKFHLGMMEPATLLETINIADLFS